MAGATVIAAGKAIISASGVVAVVKSHAVSFAKEEFKGLWDLRKNVTELSTMLESIQADLNVAEERQDESEDIRKWLRKLKNVAYDLEDVLDDYALEGPAEEEENMGALTQWTRLAINSLWLLCDVPLSCFGIATPVTRLRNISHRLQSIKKELERINQEKEGLGFLQGLSGEARPSDSMSSGASTYLTNKEQPMVGRSETKDEIKKVLLESSSKVTVVGITGLGGMGKTTLAKEIFSDEDMEKPFPIRKWVFVGVKFDAVRLIDQIIRENKDDDLPKDLGALQSKLVEKIKDHGFLIVLDDAWCNDRDEWDKLYIPLTNGEKGGALVVTARDQAVASAIPCGQPHSKHPLKEMPEEDCLEILKQTALKGQKTEDRELQCKQIAKKLKGVPLAADIMGRFLGKHLENNDIWRDAITDVGWSVKGEEELVHRVTGLSYRHLPSHLKPCFAYCSIFPKGFRFVKETLVRMWIAQGYIQPRGNKLKEHIGSVYFDELCQMSFFQLDKSNDYYYVMHDLVNDFAQKIFPEGRGRIVAGDREAPEEVRHVSLHLDDSDSTVFQNLQKYKKLRTLMIYAPDITAPALDVLREFKYIRVLVLAGKISEFLVSIGHLKLLRYLDISQTGVQALPELVCNLLHLQVLKLDVSCTLHQATSKLVNLRCLEGAGTDLGNLQQLGRLTSLQELEWYYVPKQRGRIKELGSLNNLHGSLYISGLENLQGKEEALLANLKDKVYLEELVLKWKRGRGDNEGGIRSSDSQVLEGLCPPPNLKELIIRDNLGDQPPSWMKEQHQLSDVRLDGCSYWKCLPPLGQLPLLKRLDLSGVKAVKKVGKEFFCVSEHSSRRSEDAFPHLNYLSISNMDQWEGWDYMPVGRVFPSLQVLDLDDCPKLTSLSPMLRHMTTLTELKIHRCAELASLEEDDGEWMFPSLRRLEIKSCPKLTSLSPMLRHMTTLTELEIYHCAQLASLEEDGGEWMFASLRTLKIQCCPKLTSLSPVLRHMTTLTELNIYRCAQLSSLEEDGGEWMFASLRRLEIQCCPKLTSLSPMLRDLSALEFLLLLKCDQLSCLVVPPLLPSLKSLNIKSCPMLKELATLPSSSQKRQEGNDDHGEGPPSSSFPRLQSFSTDNRCLLMWILPQKLGSLESLKITDPHHDHIRFTEAEEEGWKHLTSLSAVTMGDCPELESLPSSLPASLRELYIYDCPRLESLPSSMHILPSLHTLNLRHCPKINRLPDGGLPASLRELTIWKCPELESLPSSMHILPSLHKLYLQDCPKINRLPDGGLPASLRELFIHDCPELESLPSSMHILPSLHSLYLMHCPKINRLPDGGLPASLRDLTIHGCPELVESCQEGGPDHHKIPSNAHISLLSLSPDST